MKLEEIKHPELKNHINKQLDLYNKFLEQTESEVEKI